MKAKILAQGTTYSFGYLDALAKLLHVAPNSPVFRRLARAHQLVGKVKCVEAGTYTVQSQTGADKYQVTASYQPQLTTHSCTCPDFRQRWNCEGQQAQPCKHQYAVLLHNLQQQ